MEEHQATVIDTTSGDGGKAKYPPKRTQGLMPPWRSGQSGNPSGLTKDGLPAKNNRVRQDLQAKLADPKLRERFIRTWIAAACDGDSAAREQILKRIDPIEVDATHGKAIMEGIRLELAPDGAASVTVLRGGELREIGETGVPGGGLAREACGLAAETYTSEDSLQESPPPGPTPTPLLLHDVTESGSSGTPGSPV